MMRKDNTLVAFVCTGNTCRSPMAEGIFNKLTKEKGISARAESFGMDTVTGMEVSENSFRACAEIGVNLSEKKSVSVSDADLKKYDAFYCMSARHAEMLVRQWGIEAEKIKVLNIPDPYGGNLEIYRYCRDAIQQIVEEILKEYED